MLMIKTESDMMYVNLSRCEYISYFHCILYLFIHSLIDMYRNQNEIKFVISINVMNEMKLITVNHTLLKSCTYLGSRQSVYYNIGTSAKCRQYSGYRHATISLASRPVGERSYIFHHSG